MTTITLPQLAALALQTPARAIRNWWLQRRENHYLMCAEVEERKQKEAAANVKHYQTQAALARSARVSQ